MQGINDPQQEIRRIKFCYTVHPFDFCIWGTSQIAPAGLDRKQQASFGAFRVKTCR